MALSPHGRSSAGTKQLLSTSFQFYFLSSLFSSPETVPGGRNSLCRALCWYLLLTGNITGRRPAVLLFIFYFLFFSLLLTGDITGKEALFSSIFFVGTFSSPETLPGGGQLCFSSTLLRRLTRGTNAQHFWLSLSMGAHVLGYERRCSCLNCACRTVPR